MVQSQGQVAVATQKQELMSLMQHGTVGQIIESSLVAERFMDLYKVVNGFSEQQAHAFYAAEKFHFLKLVNDSVQLQQCTKLSLYGVFMDVAVNGLSFDPTMKHLYVVPYSNNLGTKDSPKWEKRANLQISGYGELLLRQQQGQIKYVDNPVLVYEGDLLRCGTRDGRTFVEHEICIPRKTSNVIASYLKITRNDGSVDYKIMTSEDIQALRKFSKDPDSKSWTDGFAGMAMVKTIKHAFKNYPKLRVGRFSQLQTEVVDTMPEQDYDYGIDDSALQAEYAPVMMVGQIPQPAQPIPVQQSQANPAQQAVTNVDTSNIEF